MRLPPTSTLGQWRRAARRLLHEAGIESAAVEADLILRHVLDLSAADLHLQGDRLLVDAERRRLSRILHKRLARIPLQYLMGEVDFAGLTLKVTPAALIPRPETEGLVERVLAFLPQDAQGPVLDVGTGSGCIALALAVARPELGVFATEIDAAAARLARANVRRAGLEARVKVLVGDLLGPYRDREPAPALRVVVSNPPYVASRLRPTLSPEVLEHEPAGALFALEAGLAVIRRLAREASPSLAEEGLLAMEIGEEQGEAVRAILAGAGGWQDIRIEKDLAGRDRYALARRKD